MINTREEKDQFTNLVPMKAFDFIYHIIHYIDGTNKDIVTEVKKGGSSSLTSRNPAILIRLHGFIEQIVNKVIIKIIVSLYFQIKLSSNHHKIKK